MRHRVCVWVTGLQTVSLPICTKASRCRPAAGVSGDTTAAGRQRLAFVLDHAASKPALVLLGLGGNDMLRGIDAAETRANLDAMLAELKRRDIPVLLTGMVAAPNLGADYAKAFDRKSTRLHSSHSRAARMPSSA